MQKLELFIMKKTQITILVILVITIVTSCSKTNRTVFNDDSPTSSSSSNLCVFTNDFTTDPNDTTSVYLDWNHPALEIMRSRAEIMGNIRWTPKGEIPRNNGVFPPWVEVTGIPYSSVKELNKFVGQEVSFYTFLSAVNNPRSVLYTENVGLPPYHGTHCASYYGSVCNTTVIYALGIDRPYPTFMIGTLPFIKKVAVQDLEHAAPGDIVSTPGHVYLITNIIKDSEDNIQSVHILESNGISYTRTYTKQGFLARLYSSDYTIYRYMNLKKLLLEPSPFPAIESNLYADMTNNALSPSRGDRVTYSTDDTAVIINVLESGYDKLRVIRVDDEIKAVEYPYNGTPDIALTDLAPGKYKAVLAKNDGTVSNPVWFEVLQTDVSYWKRGDCIYIGFNSVNAIPDYIVFCEKHGTHHFIADITKDDRRLGYKKIICKANPSALYLKVFFRGEYGRVSNAQVRMD